MTEKRRPLGSLCIERASSCLGLRTPESHLAACRRVPLLPRRWKSAMRRRTFAVAVMLPLLAKHAVGQQHSGLAFPSVVDAVVVDRSNGAVLMAVFVDRSLDEPSTREALLQKIGYYAEFVRSGTVHRKFPESKPNAGVIVEFFFLPPRSAYGRESLAIAESQVKQYGFASILTAQSVEAKKRHPSKASD